jgi:hypothetical protein
MLSGITAASGAMNTSSIARPAAPSRDTISIASMLAPDEPIALASRPSEPGTSGSSTRSR